MPVYYTIAVEEGPPGVGWMVRDQRRRRGWRLQDLASRVAVSAATLSAIENDKISLEIDLLVAISRALGVPVDSLLPRSQCEHFCIARRTDVESRQPLPMKLVNRTTGALSSYHNRLRPLAESFVGKYIEPFDIEVCPLPADRARFIGHHHEEFAFVLRGEIECLLKTPDGLLRETLGPGDSIHFWSYLPHCMRSTGPEAARSLHVFCSPDEPVDSGSASDGAGPIYLMDAFAKTLSAQIAERVVTLRRSRGMSTAEFARFLGVSPRRLLGVERGRRPITVALLFDLCRKCRKPKEFFLAGTPVDRPYYQVRRARRSGRRGNTMREAFSEGLRCCGPGRRQALVTDDRRLTMVPFLVTLDARGTSSDALVEHPGQEFLYVLKGAVRLLTVREGRPLGDVLTPGDGCFMDASVPHRYVDVPLTGYDRQPAEAILVVSRRG